MTTFSIVRYILLALAAGLTPALSAATTVPAQPAGDAMAPARQSGEHAHADDDDTGHADTAHDDAGHEHQDEEPHSSNIPAAMAAASGIRTAVAAAGPLQQQAHLFGVISAMPERQLRISAPYAGLVQQVTVRVGDKVKAGQLLATVQNSATLKSYAIVAPQAGEVTARFLNSGEKVADQPLLEISDFSEVYLELSVFPTELARLKTGQPLWVYDLHQDAEQQKAAPQPDHHNDAVPHAADAGTAEEPAKSRQPDSVISYIAPQMTAGHIARARAVLDNVAGHWRPGMHVQADVTVERKTAAVRIEQSALQRRAQQWVVFVQQGEQYLARPVRLGLRDDRYAEVQSGLQSGERYVVQNSFLLKADLEKSGASHQH